jgi:hypothetical protein
VACVGARPITAALVQHWTAIARKSAQGPASQSPSPSAHGSSAHGSTATIASSGGASQTSQKHVFLEQAMGFLLSAYWVIGEAHDLHVGLSTTTVQRQYVQVRKQQFPKRGEFEKFLKDSGQSVADLLFRVKLNLLSQRIQRHVVAGHRGASSQQQALARFVARFKRKWKAQTYCTRAYAVANCGHVRAGL